MKKTVRILSLKLSPFKGIKSLDLDFGGDSAGLYGDNATGKTTFFDACCWLTIGVDSLGHAPGKGFDILELEDGVPTGSEATAEAEIDVDGRLVKLKKIYRQKMTTSADEVTARPTGHTTAHFIDGVPRSQREYNDEIVEIAGAFEIWRLLMDPLYFSEELPWKIRRFHLLDICGNVTDVDVVAEGVDFGPLLGILETRSFDDHLDVLGARKIALAKERERIPVRIDEARWGLPEADGGLETGSGPEGENETLIRLSRLHADRRQAETDRQRIESGGEVAVKATKLEELRAEILREKNAAQRAAGGAAAALRKGAEVRARQESTARMELERLELEVATWRGIVINLATVKVDDEARRGQADAEAFEHDDETNCASCGHSLAPEKVKEARDRARKLFNTDKAKRLELIDLDISRARRKTAELWKSIEEREMQAAAARVELATANSAARDARAATEAPVDGTPSKHVSPPVNALMKLLAEEMALDLKIKALQEDSSEALEIATGKVSSLDQSISGAETTIARFGQRRQAETRIEELKAQEKDLARQAEDTNRGLWLCDQFTRAKVRLVEAEVNQHFELARFRLFRVQVNGRVEPVCDVLGPGGVPFGSGLNGAGRIKVGIDIIRTLQKHFGVSLPMWADDAMLIFDFPPMSCQVIRLVGSKADVTLRLEKASG